jgi:hypothetical protein
MQTNVSIDTNDVHPAKTYFYTEEMMAFKSKKFPFNVNFRRVFVPKTDAKGEPIVTKKGETRMLPAKFEFPIEVPYGSIEDFTNHWKKEGLNPDSTLTGILNQNEKQSKEGFKGEVRAAVLEVESRLYTPKLTPAELIAACRKDDAVLKALEDMQANVTANHIGQPRNKDVTKTLAAKVGVELLKQDPDTLKQLAAQLGIELP